MRVVMVGLVVLMIMNGGVGAAIADQFGGAQSVWATSMSRGAIASGRVVNLVLGAVAERLGLR